MMTISHNIVTLARKKIGFTPTFLKSNICICGCFVQHLAKKYLMKLTTHMHIIKIKIFGEHIYVGLQSISFKAQGLC
jgi:hypothetical protein